VGSGRKNGNTKIITAHALKAAAEDGIDTELIELAGKDIRICRACGLCATKEECAQKDDLFPGFTRR